MLVFFFYFLVSSTCIIVNLSYPHLYNNKIWCPSSSFKTKSILSQQNVENLVSSGAQKAIKETGQGRGGKVSTNKNSRRGMGRVSEKRPVSICFNAIMVPFSWALCAFCYFKMPFAFPENHEIGSLALSALGWCHQGTSVNYINELQYFLISFLFV